MSILLLLTIQYTNYYYYYYYYMANAASKEFTVAQTVAITNATTSATISLSPYVDPGDNQGIEITRVDYIFHNSSDLLPYESATAFGATVQLKDNVEGGLISFENIHLVSSASYDNSAAYVITAGESDVFPDTLPGPGRTVVNDDLEIVSLCSDGISDFACTVRVTMRIIKLTKRNWMQIALQTVADN